MVKETFSEAELLQLFRKSEFPMKRFFNTSGVKYRELGLKDQLPNLSEEEAARLLASDGMLIKRPMLVKDQQVIAFGFKVDEYEGEFLDGK